MPQGEVSHAAPVSRGGGSSPVFRPSYDSVVLSDTPVLYLGMNSPTATEPDLGSGAHTATYHGAQPPLVYLPNGEKAADFDGRTQYLEVADANDLSPATSGILTFEAWMRPDVLEFPDFDSTGYVHWMGKGVTSQHEWVCRMYCYTTTDIPGRANRISGYCFNLAGGTGVGAYFQDVVTAGQWIHYACTINTVNVNVTYPTGYTTILKNGVQRDTQSLSSLGIVPSNGTAPMRVGTRDLTSFFQGAIGKVAVYSYELSTTRLLAHYNQMMTT